MVVWTSGMVDFSFSVDEFVLEISSTIDLSLEMTISVIGNVGFSEEQKQWKSTPSIVFSTWRLLWFF